MTTKRHNHGSSFTIVCSSPTEPATVEARSYAEGIYDDLAQAPSAHIGIFDDLEHALHAVRGLIRFARLNTAEGPHHERTVTLVLTDGFDRRLDATHSVFNHEDEGVLDRWLWLFNHMVDRTIRKGFNLAEKAAQRESVG